MKQIVIATNYVDYTDKRRRMAQDVAMQVLSMCPRNQVSLISFDFKGAPEPLLFSQLTYSKIHHMPILKRDSFVELDNTRHLPYIKEIFDNCCKIKCDCFGYINSDILIPSSVYNILELDFDAFIFSRSEIAETDLDSFLSPKRPKIIYGGNSHEGADAFFFKKEWWNVNKNSFPNDLVLGETEWDTCYRLLIKKIGARYVEARALYHVYHSPKWDVNSPAGINNRKILNTINEHRT
jgi:hypothetical protein